ncbi:cobalt transporter [Methanoculleus sp. FWC-SCC1]|uniref:Cobalt transporter n=1 Tax=Methanoculleus frigidifontis TaxID=2584085 RepID=A0ABT8M7K5_9EURY|nr:PDGLE domain-containing protein [Methanoculleus sp. FWC-SCC1]MDN7023905.1 cobalt transporter [Methanoculleus sp. FWC-SCC1]
MDRMTFIIAGIAVALIIAVAAPFLASGNPDGLESAFFSIYDAKSYTGDELDEEAAGAAEERVVEVTGNDFAYESPLPDYTVPGMDTLGEVLAVVIGTLLIFGIAFGISRISARPDK